MMPRHLPADVAMMSLIDLPRDANDRRTDRRATSHTPAAVALDLEQIKAGIERLRDRRLRYVLLAVRASADHQPT
jgi:hypothetical protein